MSDSVQMTAGGKKFALKECVGTVLGVLHSVFSADEVSCVPVSVSDEGSLGSETQHQTSRGL